MGGGGGCTVGQVTAWTTKTHVALPVGLPAAHIAQPGEICLGSRKDPVVWKYFIKTIKRVINYSTIYNSSGKKTKYYNQNKSHCLPKQHPQGG